MVRGGALGVASACRGYVSWGGALPPPCDLVRPLPPTMLHCRYTIIEGDYICPAGGGLGSTQARDPPPMWCYRFTIVEGDHALWAGVSEPYKHVIRAFLVHFHTAILRHSSESFNFTNGSIGVWTGCVDRVWVWVKLWSSSVDPMVLGYAVWGGYGCLGRAEEEKGAPPIWIPYPGLHAGNWVRTPTSPPRLPCMRSPHR